MYNSGGRSGWLEDAREKQSKSLSEKLRILVDMARHEGREVATPVVKGEQLDPPKYGELWSEAASLCKCNGSSPSFITSERC